MGTLENIQKTQQKGGKHKFVRTKTWGSLWKKNFLAQRIAHRYNNLIHDVLYIRCGSGQHTHEQVGVH